MKKNEKNEGISAFEAKKIRAKYTELIQNVIETNIGFPDNLKDCIIDHNMIEKIMLHFDYQFLIHEFGLDFNEFPIEFRNACIALHEEFQKDFPYASVIDTTKKNKVYLKNYRCPLNLVYHLAEYEELKKLLREINLNLINQYGRIATVHPYLVKAENVKSVNGYQLKLSIYIREINKYPCVLISKEFNEPISDKFLKTIEDNYIDLSVAQNWGNEIDYCWICEDKSQLMGLIPEFDSIPNSFYEYFEVFSKPELYTRLLLSNDFEMTNIDTRYERTDFRDDTDINTYIEVSKKEKINTDEDGLGNLTDDMDDDDMPF